MCYDSHCSDKLYVWKRINIILYENNNFNKPTIFDNVVFHDNLITPVVFFSNLYF